MKKIIELFKNENLRPQLEEMLISFDWVNSNYKKEDLESELKEFAEECEVFTDARAAYSEAHVDCDDSIAYQLEDYLYNIDILNELIDNNCSSIIELACVESEFLFRLTDDNNKYYVYYHQ